jgi:peptidyl-prolyl cis-trans isomerase A (cyclophilin A)
MKRGYVHARAGHVKRRGAGDSMQRSTFCATSLSPLPAACAALALALTPAACSPPSPPGGDRAPERPAAAPEPKPEPAPAEPAAPAAAEPAKPPGAEPTAADIAAAKLRVLDPSAATRTAPERFTVVLETTRGDLHMDVRRSWAPLGADRFYNLVKQGFYEDVAFFRVIEGFVAQVGLHGDPAVNTLWRTQRIEDDPVTQSNLPGMVTFAMGGKNSRTTQFFINLGNNANLDAMGFAPFGRVRELDVLKTLHAGYGEGAPGGRGPLQARIQREGNAYLKAEFPQLDYIKRALIVDEKSPSPGAR